MTPEHPQQIPSEDGQGLPPGLLRALSRCQPEPATVPPDVDEAVLNAAKMRLSAIRRRRVRRFIWPIATAACVILAFAIGRHSGPRTDPRQTGAKTEEDSAVVILREVSALFPNQIRAIIKDESGLKFILADEANVTSGQPLVLKVCVSDACQEIITFSGQSIDVAGHRVTVRSESGGRVVLNGESFLWSSDLKGNPVPNLRIESRHL